MCAGGPPGEGDPLLGMEIDFCAYLGDHAYDDPARCKGMEARSASGGAALVTRHACGARGDAAKIGAALSEIWSDKLRDREAHEVTLADDCVVLDAVSQIGPGELWVTAQIVVELTP
jgi:hypothetical protein